MGRLDTSPHPSLAFRAAEKADPRLFQHLELGLGLIHTEMVQRLLLGLSHGLTGYLNPLHVLLPPLPARTVADTVSVAVGGGRRRPVGDTPSWLLTRRQP